MRVAIAEDSGFFRGALSASLESQGIEVTAAVEDADQLLAAIESTVPDVVILDVCLPPTRTDEGLVAAERLWTSHPTIGVLVLSAYLATPHVARLLSSGRLGVGCMAKDQLHDVDMLVEALERVSRRGTFIDPDFVGHKLRIDAIERLLTAREFEILRSITEGHSNAGIARRHHINVKTVESNLTSIFRKLGVDTQEGNARVMAVLTLLSGIRS